MDLAEALRGMGVAAEAVSGETPEAERREILRRFADGDIRVVTNAQVLTEGFDVPEVSCILMARPTKSRALYQQAVGRGLRPAPWAGKADCLILDVVGNSERHKLITLASLNGRDLPEEKERKTGEGSSERESRNITLYAGVEKTVGLLTGFGWVKVMNGMALYASDVNVALLVYRKNGVWRAVRKDFNKEGMAGVKVLAEGPDRGYVFGAAENEAARIGSPKLLRDDAGWRSLPPSEGQLKLISRFMAKKGLKNFNPPETRGEASDLITAWKLHEMLKAPTARQKYFLKQAGAWEEGLTRYEASRRIARLKQVNYPWLKAEGMKPRS